MTLERLLDPELSALVARVQDAHGADAVSRALERAYDCVVRDVRTKLTAKCPTETACPRHSDGNSKGFCEDAKPQ